MEDRLNRIAATIGEQSMFEDISLASQIQDLFEEISSLTKLKLSDTRARLNILDDQVARMSTNFRQEKLMTSSKKRDTLKRLEKAISSVQMEENMGNRAISGLEAASSSLELLADQLCKLHGFSEMLTEANDLAQKNKALLSGLVESTKKNLQIMQGNR